MYAAPDMTLVSNVAELADVNPIPSQGPLRARKLASFLTAHPEYFAGFKQTHPTTFLYYPNNDRHPDALRSSAKFPVDRCVSMFHYDLDQGQCIGTQRVRVLSLSFVKEHGAVKLRVAQLAMAACQD